MISGNRDPFFNLALEEHLLKNGDQDFFMLWQSQPAVVVGKHQNALAEVNFRFLREKGILLARRLSGGGAVFHGPGNLNFTYIMQGETGKLVDFQRYILPVVHFLQTLGIRAEAGLRNEILVEGKKVSGNAEHVYKNRVLHHGTLLFNADLNLLNEAIRVIPGRYSDKAVQSRRSSVANLMDNLPAAPDMQTFEQLFLDYIRDRFKAGYFQPGEGILRAARDLSRTKYSTWEWIQGWSPDYEFRNHIILPAGTLEVRMKVHRGYIAECSLNSLQIPVASLDRLRESLNGSPHETGSLLMRIRASGITGCGDKGCLEEVTYGFF